MKYFTILFFTLLLCMSKINTSKLPDNCGKSLSSHRNSPFRIIGGKVSKPGEWPWQILLIRPMVDTRTGVEGIQMCGGTIINEEWVLTAAHCVYENLNPNQYTIFLGKHDLSKHERSEVKVPVSSIKIYHEYDFNKHRHDIAMLKLKTPIDFTKYNHLSPICLHSPELAINTSNCYATGWGQTEETSIARILLKVHVSIWTNKECSLRLQNIHDTNVCAGGDKNGGFGVCSGDSGGPLQCQMNERWFHVGITSWGVPCGKPGIPDVYTKVAQYYKWIRDTVERYN